MIYIYNTDYHRTKGAIKIGYTKHNDVEQRVLSQCSQCNIDYTILYEADAKYKAGRDVHDKAIHNELLKRGFKRCVVNGHATEWFYCNVDDVKSVISALQKR